MRKVGDLKTGRERGREEWERGNGSGSGSGGIRSCGEEEEELARCGLVLSA